MCQNFYMYTYLKIVEMGFEKKEQLGTFFMDVL